MKYIKRVAVWVNCKDEKAEAVSHKIERFLKSQGLRNIFQVEDLSTHAQLNKAALFELGEAEWHKHRCT